MLSNPEGFFFSNTNKASMLHYIFGEYTEEVEIPKNAIHIKDGNALFYTLTKLSPTFGEICFLILEYMAKKKNFIFLTNCYGEFSIKKLKI